jgi:hypothetical protein
VETIRKTPLGYMITPSARIPFAGRVRDDHGIDRLQYFFTHSRVEETGVNATRASLAAMALHAGPDGIGSGVLAAAPYVAWLNRLTQPSAGEGERPPQSVSLPTFERDIRAKARGDVAKDVLVRRLKEKVPQQPPLIKQHQLLPDEEGFDLQTHLRELKLTGPGVQPRYRLRLWVASADGNVESGPRVAESKERFGFIVVDELELLAEIAKEEEGLHLKLKQAVGRLQEARTKLDQLESYLTAPDFDKQFGPHAARAAEITETIAGSSITGKEVLSDFQRILKELRTNRVKEEMIGKVVKIITPLDVAVNEKFTAAEEAEREFQRDLERGNFNPQLARQSQERLAELIAKLEEALDAMGELININKLIVTLTALEKDQRENILVLDRLRKEIERRLFGD